MARAKKVASVLRVTAGERYLGDILLDRKNRVWRRADTIPPEVVLKALLARARRGDEGGVIEARSGEVFTWFLMGSAVEKAPAAAAA